MNHEEYTLKLWNSIEQIFKRNCLNIFEKFFDRSVISYDLVNLKEIRRILVVRQHDQLGDFLLSTPVFRALREFFPQAYIAVFTRTYTADLAYNNKVLVVPEKLLRWTTAKLWHLYCRVRSSWDLTRDWLRFLVRLIQPSGGLLGKILLSSEAKRTDVKMLVFSKFCTLYKPVWLSTDIFEKTMSLSKGRRPIMTVRLAEENTPVLLYKVGDIVIYKK